jgi:hypothetical protein
MFHGVRQVVNLGYFLRPLFYKFKMYYLPLLKFFTVNVKRRYIVHRCSGSHALRFARLENPAKKTSVRIHVRPLDELRTTSSLLN